MLKINEIFYSIQGESTNAGLPCIFIRLTGCNLRCNYCDTEYAFFEGNEFSINEILDEIQKYNCKLVEITGGEPLVQSEVHQLIDLLIENNYSVMMETNGSCDISQVNKEVKIIMDLKCPMSGMFDKNNYSNINYLKSTDEVKFVISNKEDYNWVKFVIKENDLGNKCIILLSCNSSILAKDELASWILEDSLNVRFHIQLHKIIWNPETRGV